MSYKEYRADIAAQILAGFAANPAIFQPNDRCGWTLVNATDSDLAGYAVRLAGELIEANEQMEQYPAPKPRPSETEVARRFCEMNTGNPHSEPK